MERNTIICGDALEVARTLPDESVNCIVTSPPYFGLRDYGVEGQIGLEDTPEAYVNGLVRLFRELRRALRSDGTCWANLGDTYSNAGKWGGNSGYDNKQSTNVGSIRRTSRNAKSIGAKEKDLLGIPWMVAFALRADGWYLRSDIIWAKPNPMPESVTDRPTKAHEYVFLLTKSPRYFYDAEAIREPYTEPMNRWGGQTLRANGASGWDKGTGQTTYRDRDMRPHESGRNKRTVWEVTTKPFTGAHFATFPEDLIEPMILAGCPKTCCATCGAPYERNKEKTYGLDDNRPQARRAMEIAQQKGLTQEHVDAIRACGVSDVGKSMVTTGGAGKNLESVQQLANEAKQMLGGYYREFLTVNYRTISFVPTCPCNASTKPGIVYDPFMGAGTTALVAQRLGRDYLGSELNPEYIRMANERIYAPPAPNEKHTDAPKTLKMFE